MTYSSIAQTPHDAEGIDGDILAPNKNSNGTTTTASGGRTKGGMVGTARTSIVQLSNEAMALLKPILTKLPAPFNPNRSDNKLIYLVASFILSILTIKHVFNYSDHILHPTVNPNLSDLELASDESMGFFDDIPSHIWKQKKQRVQDQPKHNDLQLGLRSKYKNRSEPAKWYQHNFEAQFTCPHERNVGGDGSDGSKWVCDPHRIQPTDEGAYANTSGAGAGAGAGGDKSKSEPNKCLVYSFGRGSPNTRSFDFAFETDLLNQLGGKASSCDVHFFDHRLPTFRGAIPNGIAAHPWGLEGLPDAPLTRRNFMTLKETVHHLGHEGREVDVMRIDCEGCEWNTFREWLDSGISPRQIVVTLHGAPKNEDNLFEIMESANYVIFHRQADGRYGGMWQQYGFLKLAPEFFEPVS